VIISSVPFFPIISSVPFFLLFPPFS